MSLRWRIAAALGVVAALVCAFGAIAAYVTTTQRLERGVDESLVARAADYSRFQGALRRQAGTRPSACPQAGAFAPANAAQYVAADGTVIRCIEGGRRLPVDRADRVIARRLGAASRFRTVEIDGERFRVLTTARVGGGAFVVGRSLDEVDEVLASLRRRLSVIGAIGVVAAVVAGWLIAGRIVKPVDRLRVTAEDIARTQDLTTPVPTDGAAEIGSLGRSFNTMVDALATSRREQQHLVGDASHELRTPLTSLRTNAELLARAGELGPGEYEAVVEGVQLEVQELTHLVEELVELAGGSSGNDEAPTTVELADLARGVAAREHRRSGRDIEVTAGGANAVDVRPQMIERAIRNLVDNAVKYSPSGTPVEITIDGTRLAVRDHGPGFAADDLPRVFDRFYRSVEARTRSGSGLGLAIVQQAVERHGGTVRAENAPGGGAVVGFELPPAASPSPT